MGILETLHRLVRKEPQSQPQYLIEESANLNGYQIQSGPSVYKKHEKAMVYGYGRILFEISPPDETENARGRMEGARLEFHVNCAKCNGEFAFVNEFSLSSYGQETTHAKCPSCMVDTWSFCTWYLSGPIWIFGVKGFNENLHRRTRVKLQSIIPNIWPFHCGECGSKVNGTTDSLPLAQPIGTVCAFCRHVFCAKCNPYVCETDASKKICPRCSRPDTQRLIMEG